MIEGNFGTGGKGEDSESCVSILTEALRRSVSRPAQRPGCVPCGSFVDLEGLEQFTWLSSSETIIPDLRCCNVGLRSSARPPPSGFLAEDGDLDGEIHEFRDSRDKDVDSLLFLRSNLGS